MVLGMAKDEIDFTDIERAEWVHRDDVTDIPAIVALTGLQVRELRRIRVALDRRNELLAESNRMQIERDIHAVEHDVAILNSLGKDPSQ